MVHGKVQAEMPGWLPDQRLVVVDGHSMQWWCYSTYLWAAAIHGTGKLRCWKLSSNTPFKREGKPW
jgi:hypothetical protein